MQPLILWELTEVSILNNNDILLKARNIRKSYYIGTPNELEILHGIIENVRSEYPVEYIDYLKDEDSDC